MALPEGFSAGYPIAANVRSATTYGPGSIYTGTCAVPGAASVASGVAVDNTTGTAVITAAALRSAMGLASANLDTQLAAAAMPTAAQIRAEMDANSTKLANLDATVSSRSTYAGADTSGTTTLLGRLTGTRAGYLDNISSAAPSASNIASQVRTELATELGRIDVATSTRLAPSGTLARVTLTDTATTLTNAPTVPTTSQIASQVRTELTPELTRVSNCATVESTGDQISAFSA